MPPPPPPLPPSGSASKQSQYERKMARQRQMELMEQAASGLAPAMELDTASFGQTDGSYLRTRGGGGAREHITGERPSLNLSPRKSTGLFVQDDAPLSSVNLMDHDTGIYKESSDEPNFFVSTFRRTVDTAKRVFSSSSTPDLHDASPGEPEYIGDNPYKRSGRGPSCRAICSSTTLGLKKVTSNRRRRNMLLYAVVGMAVIATTVFMTMKSMAKDNSLYQRHKHHVDEKYLRKENTDRFNEILDHLIIHGASDKRIFTDLLSPEYHALRWIAYSDPARLDPSDPILIQRYALAVFFYSSYLTFESLAGKQPPIVMGDKQWEGVPNPGWVRKDYWMSEKGHCKWRGVTCEPHTDALGITVHSYDANRPIWGLNMTKNHVVGTIPPEFKALHELKVLDLSHNKVGGTFPWQVGKMFNIEKLHLQHNKMMGTIPDQIGHMEGAKEIYLNHNTFSGNVPTELNRLYDLHVLAMNDNQFTGTIPELYNMVKLTRLYVDHNRLNGHFPYSLVRVPTLYEVYLNDNEISGTIPVELSNNRHLRVLHAENNRITGSIPTNVFRRLNHLKELKLQNNKLTGPLPVDMGSETILELVQLNDNQLTGAIPHQWDNMTSIAKLHLQKNRLSDTLPTEMGTMTTLQELWLNDNQLEGPLPRELGRLEKLETLYVERNNLTGRVPSELGMLEELHTFRMFSNKIRGWMPDDVCDLSSMHKLKNLAADCGRGGLIMKCDCCNRCL